MKKHTLTIILSIISSFFFSPSAATDEGGKLSFSVDYIHRDSPLSPYHNSSQTPHERVRVSVDRDRFRLSLISGSGDLGSIVSRVYPDMVDYLMSVSIGTPPFKIFAVADTGSDLVWTQCKPCLDCFKQDSPMFDPSGSNTYKEVSCDAGPCLGGNNFECDEDRKCSYGYRYGDGSHINGVVATDTITFDSSSGKKVAVENINTGCTHESTGTFRSRESGIIGLSPGPLSLISQLGDRIDHKFSYCLLPSFSFKSSSVFHFGSSSKTPMDSHVVKVPIMEMETFYTLNLESIIVGDDIILMDSNGKIIIDSGTTLTYLPDSIFSELKSVISKHVNPALPTAEDPQRLLDLCYNIEKHGSSPPSRLSDIVQLPDLKLDFGNNAVVTLPSTNALLKISESIVCLAIASSLQPGTSIIGNLAQQNLLVEYDVGNMELSFAPMDCTQY